MKLLSDSGGFYFVKNSNVSTLKVLTKVGCVKVERAMFPAAMFIPPTTKSIASPAADNQFVLRINQEKTITSSIAMATYYSVNIWRKVHENTRHWVQGCGAWGFQGRIQDSPLGGGRQPSGGASTYKIVKFSEKLHEIEKISSHGGGGGAPGPP